MSGTPASGVAPTTKAAVSDKGTDSTKNPKPAAALEEDDEFEDFPVESMLLSCVIRTRQIWQRRAVREEADDITCW